MKGFISIILGLMIIGIAYLLIRKELNKAIVSANSKYSHINDANTKQILKNLDNVEDTVNELNRSFYEVASDLEGKYSVHEKEIELINEGFKDFSNAINNKIKVMESQLNAQNLLIQNIEKEEKKSSSNKFETQNSKLTSATTDNNEKISLDRPKINSNNLDKNQSSNLESTSSNSLRGSHISSREKGGGYIESLNDIEKEKLRAKIIELRQQGYSLSQIAKKLGVGVGELQLVLNLQRK